MSDLTLEQRVAVLEQQMASLQAQQANGAEKKDWRRLVGVFTDDPVMLEIFAEAQKIREADRKKARGRQTKKRRVQS